MKNSFRVLKRDLIRLLRSPAALVVVIALVILPSLYTWFNVIGFWNPYDNTGNMRVCVINEDEGAENELLGSMNLGDQIVDTLHENSQLKWDFVDRNEAMEAVNSGQAYAAFVIPSDFTSDLFTILTAEFDQPNIEYYVNEKMNPVSPKVTDAGSTTLDETINSTFVSTVASTIADVLNEQIKAAEEGLGETQSEVAHQLDKAITGINDTSATLTSLTTATNNAQAQASDAKTRIQGAYAEAEELEDKLQNIYDLSVELQKSIGDFSATALPALTNANTSLAMAANSATSSIVSIANSIEAAQGSIDSAIQVAESTIQLNNSIITELQKVLDGMDEDDDYGGLTKADVQELLDLLSQQNRSLEQEVASLKTLSDDINTTAQSTSAAAQALNQGVQTSLTEANEYYKVLFGEALPEVSKGVGNVGSSALQLKAAVEKETVLIGQTSAVLDELNGTLSSASNALTQTNDLLSDLGEAVEKAQIDVLALGNSEIVQKLIENGQIDPEKVADFMLSPTQVQTEKLYHLEAYGSAMAPLFISLSLWIGAIMLCVILKLEVDNEGIPDLTVKQGWFGRWLFFAILVILQAVVCVLGCLYIGVQTVSALGFCAVAAFISLMYLTICYTLSSSFQHIGIGLCIIFVFVQIPGGTGLYPVEMTSDFFRNVYPFFPFTYGINSLREIIAGLYGNQLWQYLATLAAIGCSFGAFGLFVRPYLTNFNRLAAKEVAESDLLNNEEVLVPERRYRIAQMIRAVANHDDFHAHAEAGAQRFMRYYPRLKWAALWVGVLLPTVLTVILNVNEAEKVIILTMWLFWIFGVIIYLVIVEYIKNNLEHRSAIDQMSASEIRTQLIKRGKKQMADELHIKGEKKKWSPMSASDTKRSVPELVEGPGGKSGGSDA